MKAMTLSQPGGPENLSLQDIPQPQAKANEVLVRVHAFSINPVDIKTRKGGAFYAKLQEQPPVILGWDVSGTVVAVGSEVTKFNEGDEVFGMINFPGQGRAYAEYATAPADHLALKPKNTDHASAAATTLAALTAWQVLVHQANVKAGQHVLIHAAAGGVGHFAVQIAKHLGATVTGTASAANRAFLQSIGVDKVIDYTTQNFEEEAQDIDMVFDPLGGETTKRSIHIIKPGGTLVSIVGGIKDDSKDIIEEKNIKGINYLVHSSGADMEQLARLLEQGIIKPTVSQTFAFADTAQAHRQIETGKTRGKLVVSLIG